MQAVTLRSRVVHMLFRRLKVNNGARLSPTVLTRQQSSHSHGVSLPSGSVVPTNSLSSPPWSTTELHHVDLEEQQHAAVVRKVNYLLLYGQNYGRLFAVVQFSGRQWKVTGEDLILVENRLEAQCGDRICMEKVLMVGGEGFSLIGRPLLGCDLVRVEATVVEKTESWPKVVQRFKKRKRFETRRWMVQPQTVLRINSIQVAPALS